MPTYDDRLAALERKVAMLELRRMHDERQAEESTPPAQVLNLREINENMTILLGIIAKQEEVMGELKDSVGRIEGRLGGFDRRLEDLDGRLISFEHAVSNRFEAQNKRFDEIDQHFDSMDKKFDQVLSMLSTLTFGPQPE